MNNKIDPRTQKRIQRMKHLFSLSLSDKTEIDDTELIEQFLEYKETIDAMIAKAAPQWPIEQMNKVDLAILRTILLEHVTTKTPVKVLVNEAIEIGKLYGSQNSQRFINGALGKLLIDKSSIKNSL